MTRLDSWQGYKVVGWSVTSDHWSKPNPFVFADCLLSRIHPGAIVLCHDAMFDQGKPKRGPQPDRVIYLGCESILQALQSMFEHMGKRFRFVTVPELLKIRIAPSHILVQTNPRKAELFCTAASSTRSSIAGITTESRRKSNPDPKLFPSRRYAIHTGSSE